MSTLTHPILRSRESRLSFPRTAALVLLFWAAAAAAVFGVHLALDSISAAAAVATKAGAIVMAGWLYVRFHARHCTIDHALLVGLAWLLLDIGAEIVATQYLGKGWFDLIGSPMRPALRDLLFLTWVVAPALFAQLPSKGETCP